MIIDFHTHCFPGALAERAIMQLEKVSGQKAHLRGRVEDISLSMERAGIDYSVVLSIATKPEQTPAVNDFAISMQTIKGIIPFGSVHPLYSKWEYELSRLHEVGIKGIKLHPDYQKIRADAQEVIDLCAFAASLGMVVVLHSGVDIGLKEPYHCTPEMARRLIDAVGGDHLVMAHMGGYGFWEEVERCLVGTRVWIDTSYCLPRMERARLLRIMENHPRILFGTDSPWDDQKEQLAILLGLPIDQELVQKILWKNAASLLAL